MMIAFGWFALTNRKVFKIIENLTENFEMLPIDTHSTKLFPILFIFIGILSIYILAFTNGHLDGVHRGLHKILSIFIALFLAIVILMVVVICYASVKKDALLTDLQVFYTDMLAYRRYDFIGDTLDALQNEVNFIALEGPKGFF